MQWIHWNWLSESNRYMSNSTTDYRTIDVKCSSGSCYRNPLDHVIGSMGSLICWVQYSAEPNKRGGYRFWKKNAAQGRLLRTPRLKFFRKFTILNFGNHIKNVLRKITNFYFALFSSHFIILLLFIHSY